MKTILESVEEFRVQLDVAVNRGQFDKFVADAKNAGILQAIVAAAAGQAGFADGAVIKSYGSGGFEPAIDRVPTVRVSQEAGGPGESYIPHSPIKRQRATKLLSQTANIFGYDIVPAGIARAADGLVLNPSPSFVVAGGGGGSPEMLEALRSIAAKLDALPARIPTSGPVSANVELTADEDATLRRIADRVRVS